VVIVPTTYGPTPARAFRDLGVSLVIWANQSLRSAIAAMQATTRRIFLDGSLANVEDRLVSIAEVFRLQGEEELQAAERRYLPAAACGVHAAGSPSDERQDPDEPRACHATSMLRTQAFGALLKRHGYGFFSGVPCSYLAPLIAYASAECMYVGAVNEGDAVAHCAGARLGGTKAVVLMQNSGLTNALSPLTSLTQPFGIPVLGFVSLRTARPDEPQHAVMERATPAILAAVGISWAELALDPEEAARQLAAADRRVEAGESFFFVVRQGTFDPYPAHAATLPRRANVELRSRATAGCAALPLRHEALRALAERRGPRTVFVNTTGFTSREMYAVADAAWQFYMVGSLGCASALALGLALVRSDLSVVALDGDGALLMRLGALATNGTYAPPNFLHVLLNNGCHESTGAQATVAGNVDFAALAAASGYVRAIDVATAGELGVEFAAWQAAPAPSFLHLRTRPGTAVPLRRPALTAPALRARLERHLAEIADAR
jgi:phosphonopyruvate decarboxylase